MISPTVGLVLFLFCSGTREETLDGGRPCSIVHFLDDVKMIDFRLGGPWASIWQYMLLQRTLYDAPLSDSRWIQKFSVGVMDARTSPS